MSELDDLTRALAQLRHLYGLMMSGHVTNLPEAARGLLGPSVKRLEHVQQKLQKGCANCNEEVPTYCTACFNENESRRLDAEGKVRAIWDILHPREPMSGCMGDDILPENLCHCGHVAMVHAGKKGKCFPCNHQDSKDPNKCLEFRPSNKEG